MPHEESNPFHAAEAKKRPTRVHPLPPVVLLDLDDTILNYTSVGDPCFQNLCAEFAPQVGVTPEELWASVQRSRDWYWSDLERHRAGRLDLKKARRVLVSLAFEQLGIDNQVVANELADSFTVRREELVHPYPGAIDVLQALRDRGARLGLLTNGTGRFQRAKISRFNLEHYFDLILIEEEFGVGKPDRRVYLHALRYFGVDAREACMIGDNVEWDIRPPLELGMGAIWVDSGTSELPADGSLQPNCIVKSLVELA
jgi:putative hydrolase of the HAD superfamily